MNEHIEKTVEEKTEYSTNLRVVEECGCKINHDHDVECMFVGIIEDQTAIEKEKLTDQA